jgi:hypothetical protein
MEFDDITSALQATEVSPGIRVGRGDSQPRYDFFADAFGTLSVGEGTLLEAVERCHESPRLVVWLFARGIQIGWVRGHLAPRPIWCLPTITSN